MFASCQRLSFVYYWTMQSSSHPFLAVSCIPTKLSHFSVPPLSHGAALILPSKIYDGRLSRAYFCLSLHWMRGWVSGLLTWGEWFTRGTHLSRACRLVSDKLICTTHSGCMYIWFKYILGREYVVNLHKLSWLVSEHRSPTLWVAFIPHTSILILWEQERYVHLSQDVLPVSLAIPSTWG
ncbi:hypothetical protein DAEQUDRAFT_380383 [Daedalea quercina L-15889]|uniref:Uncharacterized protein n=1 Tax=Daedalea quercina L-15889 TaxID=1314783 RepID=A0A165P503_9APHY|nr:hypothetical protein DAEQUDRAFT_380383 [Daedalea quercina L-15889]